MSRRAGKIRVAPDAEIGDGTLRLVNGILKYRGRLAPSPTGLLHVGHARTFWTAFTSVRDAGGTLVLRLEDLDPQRSKAEFAAAAIEDLRWLGIHWQEGPNVGGPFAPYYQSERYGLYLAAWRKLLEAGFLYPCRCSRKELAEVARAPHEDDEPVYPGTCRREWAKGAVSPAGMNWRFRVPDGEAVEFEDGNFGRQRFVAGKDFGDFLVWRRDDVQAYQLAVVADDSAMGITEVVRGADLLKSTARQILLYRALDCTEPLWYHCSLVRDDIGQRLAKRNDALAVRRLREAGRSPEDVLGVGMHPTSPRKGRG